MMDNKHIFISYRRDGATNQQWAERVDARLNEYGFKVWRDVEGIQPGERWGFKIPPAIEQSALVLCIVSESLLDSEWVDAELNFAQNLKLLVVPIRIETEYRPPAILSGVQHLDLHTDESKEWNKLFEFVDRHVPRDKNDSLKPITRPAQLSRQRELEYLDRLLYTGKQVAQLTPIYTELASRLEHRVKSLARALPADLIPVSFLHQSAATRKSGEGHRYDDILNVFASFEHESPCLALLGEPGAGKSFSLRRLSALRALEAQDEPQAAIPLLVELGDWIEENQPFDKFLRESIKPLETDFDELLESGRAYLLLDALNEIPTAQQAGKTNQIRKWVDDQRLAGLVISCRERDFTNNLQLDIDTATIEPLDPVRVYQFIQRYLQVIDPENAKIQGEKLFWQLATGHSDNYLEIEVAKKIWQQLQDEGVHNFQQFWQCAQDIPLAEADRQRLDFAISTIEKDRSSLLKLTEIPYLLNILVGLFLEGKLPEQGKSRAEVFTRFVEDLLLRERKRYQKATENKTPPGEAGLLVVLAELAWNLQRASNENQQTSTQTRLLQSSAQMTLSEAQLNHAVAANLLQLTSQQVNFIHQLLQEYFAALGLKSQIETKQLPAEELWPRQEWWKPAGWEETVITEASFFADDLTTFIKWLGDANPELLAECLVFNGLLFSENDLLQLKTRDWIQRMTDPVSEPNPESRAAIGRALAKLGCDDRTGVGLNKKELPDIDWVEIPGGEFLYGEEKESRKIEPFFIAKYPITNEQYEAFINDAGYRDDRWWEDLSEVIIKQVKPAWDQSNRPREFVSWYEAIAFCRWSSHQLGYTVQLPTEEQWERAARGIDGREYPWGDKYLSGYANINEKREKVGAHYLEQTSAVGLYPSGGTPEGVLDLAGNVWEWCLNEYNRPENTALEGDAPRVLRGGSWYYYPGLVRASIRSWSVPDFRLNDIGFRVVCSSPIIR